MPSFNGTRETIARIIARYGNTITLSDSSTLKGFPYENPDKAPHWLPEVVMDQPIRTNVNVILPYTADGIIQTGTKVTCMGRRLTAQRVIPIAAGDTLIALLIIFDP